MNFSLKDKSISAKITLVAAAVALVSLIAFIIYGIAYSAYADFGVGLFLLLGVLGYLAYVFFDGVIFNFMPLVAVFCSSFALGLFALNAYPVLGDWYGNFNMYGSQGGIGPVIAIIALIVASVLCGIVVCFTRKNKEAK